MANRTLIRQFESADIDAQLDELFKTGTDLSKTGSRKITQSFEANKIVTGTVREIRGEDVIIDIGYKSEGIVKDRRMAGRRFGQARTRPALVRKIEVLLETVEDDEGTISLSYRKAKRQKEWEAILEKHKEGDVVKGKVLKKIKGGLLVNIGVNVFLPASPGRYPPAERTSAIYIGQEIECEDSQDRRSPPQYRRVSRRKLIEDRRKEQREEAARPRSSPEKQIRKGVVKNIADFGAFVDLGGIDGLLHITDMGWRPRQQPAAMWSTSIRNSKSTFSVSTATSRRSLSRSSTRRRARGRTSKRSTRSTAGTAGEVVNIMPYGAFVKLEPGIEGLVHISEMSWTKRISHPNEVVGTWATRSKSQVLNINHDKKEISLGMKQCSVQPVGRSRQAIPDWHDGQRRGPQPHELRGLHRNRRRNRRPPARQRI